MTEEHIRAVRVSEMEVVKRDDFIVLKGSGLDRVLTRAAAQHLARALKEASE